VREQFVAGGEERDGVYVHPRVEVCDSMPRVDPYAWSTTSDTDSLVRAWADNAFHGLRAALRDPQLRHEIVGDGAGVCTCATYCSSFSIRHPPS